MRKIVANSIHQNDWITNWIIEIEMIELQIRGKKETCHSLLLLQREAISPVPQYEEKSWPNRRYHRRFARILVIPVDGDN